MKKNPQPLYFLLGEDEFRKQRFLKELKETVFPEGRESLNYEYLLGEEADAPRILDAARVSREARKYRGLGRKWWSASSSVRSVTTVGSFGSSEAL